MDGAASWGPPAAAGLLALVAVEQLDDLLADPVEVGAQLHQDLSGDTLALTDQAQQDVLGADVVVTELQRLAQRQLKDLLGTGREGNVPGRRRLALADDLLDLLAHALEADPQALESLGGHAFTLMDQTKKNVLGADVVVVEHPGLFLGQDDHPPRTVGEPLEHSSLLTSGRADRESGSVVPHASPGTENSQVNWSRRSPGAGRSPSIQLLPEGTVFPIRRKRTTFMWAQNTIVRSCRQP